MIKPQQGNTQTKGVHKMKMTDGRKTITITMQEWNGSGYGPDFSQDFFGGARYNWELDCYVVPDVDYCVDQAFDYKTGRGDFSDCEPNDNLDVSVITITH